MQPKIGTHKLANSWHDMQPNQSTYATQEISWVRDNYQNAIQIKKKKEKVVIITSPLLTSIQRPTVSLGSVSSGDKKDSTLSSREPSSAKGSISACNSRSLSSHCWNGIPMRIHAKKWKIPSVNTRRWDLTYQMIWWWCKSSSTISAKHHQWFWRATTVWQSRHWDYISRCVSWGCRGCWAWGGSCRVCSSWAIGWTRRWNRLLSLSSSLVFWSLKID